MPVYNIIARCCKAEELMEEILSLGSLASDGGGGGGKAQDSALVSSTQELEIQARAHGLPVSEFPWPPAGALSAFLRSAAEITKDSPGLDTLAHMPDLVTEASSLALVRDDPMDEPDALTSDPMLSGDSLTGDHITDPLVDPMGDHMGDAMGDGLGDPMLSSPFVGSPSGDLDGPLDDDCADDDSLGDIDMVLMPGRPA